MHFSYQYRPHPETQSCVMKGIISWDQGPKLKLHLWVLLIWLTLTCSYWLTWLILTCFFSQLIPIVQTKSEKKPAVNGSYIAQINPADKGCLLEKYSSKYTDCEFGLLANLYASEGQPGKVCTWIKGDFACRALWLKGNSCFSVLLSVFCDNSKVVIPWKKYQNIRNWSRWTRGRNGGNREAFGFLRVKY